ncbi:VWA domain-containing protein, partial [Thermodesulfobacteriota bacterium]
LEQPAIAGPGDFDGMKAEDEGGLFSRGLWSSRGGDEEDTTPFTGVNGSSDSPSFLPCPVEGASSWTSRTRAERNTPSSRPFRGRHVRAVPALGNLRDLDWDATIRSAAAARHDPRSNAPVRIRIGTDDLQRKYRLHRPGRLLLVVVDGSGSMGGRLLELAKNTALSLIERAYVRRDHVSMIVFRERRAELLFSPTNQARLVHRALADLPCGGTTPLARGLELAWECLRRTASSEPELDCNMLLISDGRANVGSSPGFNALHAEVDSWSALLASRLGLRILFLDTTVEGKDDSTARRLSARLGAGRFLLWRIIRSGLDPATEILKAMN